MKRNYDTPLPELLHDRGLEPEALLEARVRRGLELDASVLPFFAADDLDLDFVWLFDLDLVS